MRVLAALFVVLVASPAFAKTPKVWFGWMQELRLTSEDFTPGAPLNKTQRNIERVFQVLFRLSNRCGSLDYGLDYRPFTQAVSKAIGHEWPLWAAFGPRPEDKQHPDVEAEVDAAFAADGKVLCETMAKRIGTGGDLVPAFERFTAGNAPDERFVGRVLWRPKDICAEPARYWRSQWTDQANQPELEDMRKRICGVAGVAP